MSDGTPKFYPPHEGQKDFCFNNPKARFRLALAGVQGGKTEIGCRLFARQLMNTKNGEFCIAAPFYKILDQATLVKMRQVLNYMCPPESTPDGKGWIVHSDERIRQRWLDRNGNIIYLRSTSDPNGLRGPTLNGVFFDECAMERSPQAFRIFLQRVNVKRGFIYLTTTPQGANWIVREFIEPYMEGDPDYHFAKWASFVNPAFDRKQYEAHKKTMPEAWVKQEYEAEITGFGGRVFSNFEERLYMDTPEEPIYEYNPDLPVYWSIDFGVANPFSCGIWQYWENYDDEMVVKDDNLLYDETGTYVADKGVYVRIDEVHYVPESTYDAINFVLSGRPYPKPVHAICDPAGRNKDQSVGTRSTQMFGLYDIGVRFEKDWNTEVVQAKGIREAFRLISLGRIRASHRCVNFRNSMKYYSYRTAHEGEEVPEKPDKGMYSHAADDFKYFVLGRPHSRIESTPEQYAYYKHVAESNTDEDGLPIAAEIIMGRPRHADINLNKPLAVLQKDLAQYCYTCKSHMVGSDKHAVRYPGRQSECYVCSKCKKGLEKDGIA